MKKLTLILAMSSVLVLTACSKEVTEVQKGSTVPATKAQQAALSTNNAADITEDMSKMQALATEQQAQAGDLDQRLNAALQSADDAAVKKLFPEFKAAMQKNLTALSALSLKSTEVNELRQKLNELMQTGLNMQEKLLNPTVKPEQVQAEQAKIAQLQQEINLVSLNINNIVNPTAAATPEGLSQLEDAAAETIEPTPATTPAQ